uniref:Transposase n=1 Tax=Heterorhabditis bacteriophora TaxID=37862 RepID=A0A1I7WNB1_HETBA
MLQKDTGNGRLSADDCQALITSAIIFISVYYINYYRNYIKQISGLYLPAFLHIEIYL